MRAAEWLLTLNDSVLEKVKAEDLWKAEELQPVLGDFALAAEEFGSALAVENCSA